MFWRALVGVAMHTQAVTLSELSLAVWRVRWQEKLLITVTVQSGPHNYMCPVH